MKIVIIGNGITGITCARHLRKLSDHEILVISEESEHFFSRTALMYIYMGHMKYEHTKPYEDWFWKKNRIDLLMDTVTGIDIEKKTISLKNQEIKYDKLVIATGSKPNKFGWPGQDLQGVQGLYSKQDLELMEENTKNIRDAVIVGGGLIGIETAEMLASRGIKVHFLIREKNYWGSILPPDEAQMINRHIAEHHINLITETELAEIKGDENGRVKSIVTNKGTTINCQFVALTVGVSPNIDVVKSSPIATEKGVLVNEFLETNIKDVYSAGDCAQFIQPKEHHPAVEQLWYTGKMQAEALAQTICGNKTAYNRGIWFNSAKFLDIEYQTYGLIFNKPAANEATFYWEHPKGKISIRINYKVHDFTVTGFIFMGIRFRQVVADEWIRNNENLKTCISSLNKGFFDPEFQINYHQEIIDHYNQNFPDNVINLSVKKKFLIF